jgi:hypothetical protein
MQGVCRLKEISVFERPEEGFERLLLQGVRKVKSIQHLEVFEGFPQGVHAGVS